MARDWPARDDAGAGRIDRRSASPRRRRRHPYKLSAEQARAILDLRLQR
ncbi:MAG: hypothetical protein R3D52_01585 [Xanthobacteraceae bacterium]